MDDKFVVVGLNRELTDTPDVPFLVKDLRGQAVFFGSIVEATDIKDRMSNYFSYNQYRVGRVVIEDDAFDLTPPDLPDGSNVTKH